MKQINISVADKLPKITAMSGTAVTDNTYLFVFDFDDEWLDGAKTVYVVNNFGKFVPYIMDGNSVEIQLTDARYVDIGISQGTLVTSLPCRIVVNPSIKRIAGEEIPPPAPDVYDQIMDLLNKLGETGASPEQIQAVLEQYIADGNLTPNEIGAVAQNQGQENADKILGIDAVGEVVPVDKPSDGTENAVTYTEQELTAEEQAQARENIGAEQESIIVKITGNSTDGYATTLGSSGIQEYLRRGRNVIVTFNVMIGSYGYSERTTEMWDASQGDESRTKIRARSQSHSDIYVTAEVYEGMYGTGVSVYTESVVATSRKYGLIKADPAESTDTVPARIGDDGKLYVDAFPSSTLQSAINTALAQAKESGEFDGEDGASVTITNTTESTEDGGENVVEFSDGNKMTVRNGKTGAQGDPGVYVGSEDTMPKGTIVRIDPDGEAMELVEVDDTLRLKGYAADAKVTGEKLSELSEAIADLDIPQITQEAGESESLVMSQKAVTDLVRDALGENITTEYETVDSVDAMTDTSKQYVLSSTNTVWSYGETTKEVIPNQFIEDEATYNARISSSGSLSTGANGILATGFISVPLFVNPYVVKIRGVTLKLSTAYQYSLKTDYFNGSTRLGGAIISSSLLIPDENGEYEIDIYNSTYTDTTNIRFSMCLADNVSIDTADTTDLFIEFVPKNTTETVGEWYDTGLAPEDTGGGNYVDLLVKVNQNKTDIAEVSKRVTALETGSDTLTIPTFWEDAVAACISKIKALQVGKNCITFPFFSDNHQRLGYSGMLIAYIMKECHIPYCFYGGDSISSGYIADEATMTEQDKAFDETMSYIPNGRFCRAVGNHDGHWAVSADEKYYYTDAQIYDLFLREESVAQNKHFGGDGTYYYVDDIASKVRFVILDTNDGTVEAEQITWIQNVALSFAESGWAVVFISHQPISNHYHANISNAAEVRAVVTDYINGTDANKADVVGWYSGHIHRDRIYTGIAVNTSDDSEGDAMPFKQITITSDHTGIAYDDATKHTVANDDQSHAIDFVTINKATRTVNLTRLGIGNDRNYTY